MTWRKEEGFSLTFGFLVEALPNFTDHRFSYLSKEEDQRNQEVARKQMAMIRQFHLLGEEFSVSLRLVKAQEKISLYILFRYCGNRPLSREEESEALNRIRNCLPADLYTFRQMSDEEIRTEALDLDWANEAAEIFKDEQEYFGDFYPTGSRQPFYVPQTWMSTDNSMEVICSSLMAHHGKACVEITLSPTDYLDEELDWVNVNIRQLRECMNGETLRDQSGRIVWQGKKLPVLKNPMDMFEKMNKQYESSREFMTSIRVFADQGAKTIAEAYLINSVKNTGVIQTYKKGFNAYRDLERSYQSVSLSVENSSRYWKAAHDWTPYRAQRLHRLASVEEAANFFRIPIPVKSGFPGFDYDTGLGSGTKSRFSGSEIVLGSYQDEQTIEKREAKFTSQQFAKHGLIVGVPGSGKTTAMFNILYQLWNQPEEQRIPFIVLEPAKTEYRALKKLDIFQDDMLVFTLGDEGVSPFRFNPLYVLPGVKIENHISKLQACFVGAFDLFDPLPIFLEQAIRRTYAEKGWYEDSKGGDPGLETPTLSDLSRNAEYIVSHSGFDAKMRSDFNASLLERLNSLRRGSKGRMLDTKETIDMDTLMKRPIVMELDSLNGDEKSLMMMFLLSYVFEYCKVQRKSGSPLRHMLIVEEAHNLIGSQGAGSDSRANPKQQTIELFINMLAEMRALGQGILIADQLPTAIAPQAVKQTNVKVLMRVTAKDDREEIGNTMDLNEEQMHQVVNFKTGYAYLYHEGENRVRFIRMLNFKGEHDVEEPPEDEELRELMEGFELSHPDLFKPFAQCSKVCQRCSRRVRNQAESFVSKLLQNDFDIYKACFPFSSSQDVEKMKKTVGVCNLVFAQADKESKRIQERYGSVGDVFGRCVYIHWLNMAQDKMKDCTKTYRKCRCDSSEEKMMALFDKTGKIDQ